jgi:hypothetical protein
MARCVASHLNPRDIFLSTDWNWAEYLGYFFGRKEISVINWAATFGDPRLALDNIWQLLLKVQGAHGDAYVTDLAAYSSEHLQWLQSTTGIGPRELSPYQGPAAFVCQGIILRQVPVIQQEEPVYVKSDENTLSLSAREVTRGHGYGLTISGAAMRPAMIHYRLNDGPIKKFAVRLDSNSHIEFHVDLGTPVGVYRFVGFQVAGHVEWAAADATLVVK